MTGYGSHQVSSQALALEISIRSVNGRFLETKFALPPEYMSLETQLKSALQKKWSRGSITVHISRHVTSQAYHTEIRVDVERALQWMNAYRNLGKGIKLMADPNLDMIARLPDVIQTTQKLKQDMNENQIMLKGFQIALEECEKERAREGQALKKLLLKDVERLEKTIQQMRGLSGQVSRHIQNRLETRLKKLKISKDVDPSRFSQELAFLLEKSDIQEELSRLSEHTKAIKKLINSTQAEGKKLDFYIQELLRETNTIGSKSQLAKLTETVVQSKVIIEQLREQVQNVE